MILTVVSGKGGAGKTSISATIATILPTKQTVIVDADVDTPNLALALGVENPVRREQWYGGIVAEYTGGKFDPKVCPFGAIEKDGRVNELLCEGRGVCVKRYPSSYRLKNVKTAEILEYRWKGMPLITAELEPGRHGSGKIVTEVRRRAENIAEREHRNVILIDAAAGRGCPVIASIRGADAAVLVIDNSVTGISDAEEVVRVLNHFGIPFFFVVNRVDLAPERLEKIVKHFEERGGTFIGAIPYMEDVLRTYPVPTEKIAKHINVKEILQRI